MHNILNGLNKEQIDSVLYNNGPLLLLAGAGTGKTKVLTSKIAYVIKSNLVYPSQILAVTFTNKAANEMKERVAKITELDVNSMWIGTFHSICVRILRQNGDFVGIDNNFTIIDQSEQTTIIKQIMKDLDMDPKEFSPKSYAEYISRYKDKINTSNDSLYMFNEIYDKYEQKLRKSNMCDFSDLLIYTIKLLRDNDEKRKYYNDKFKYIFVDEYQDTNSIQNEWLKLISGINENENKNITCVGDDDQSIYGWRGAEIKNILKFTNDFKNAKIFKLERNYRSTQNILDVAYSIIKNNKNRHSKSLYANDKKENGYVKIVKCNDNKHESIFLADEISKLKNNSFIDKYKDMAILVRAGYQTRIIEDAFLKNNIPYVIIGGLKFYERQEIKDCIGYLRLVNNINDDLAFERVINIPRRGIGSTTIEKIRNLSIEKGLSMIESSLYLCRENIIKGKTKDEIIMFIKKIKEWQNNSKNVSLMDLMKIILAEAKILEYFEKDGDIESKNRLDNIEELVGTLADFTNISDFLEHVSLVNDNNQKNNIDAVNMLTIHAAKGLEFDTVFLPNWQEGVFPSPKSIEERNGIEEERRLAYVAITRAMKNIYITYAKHKYECHEIVSVDPSQFVEEIADDTFDFIDISNDNSYYNSYYRKQEYNDNNKYRFKDKDNQYNNMEQYESFAEKQRKIDNFEVVSYINKDNSIQLKKCFHNKFGFGYIKKQDGDKLTIVFKNSGEKTILKSFVEILE